MLNLESSVRSKAKPRPTVPLEIIRNYTKHLLRMYLVAQQVQAGHPWFENQMQNYAKAAQALKKRVKASPPQEVKDRVALEVLTRMQGFRLEPPTALRIFDRLATGTLPLVNTNAPL